MTKSEWPHFRSYLLIVTCSVMVSLVGIWKERVVLTLTVFMRQTINKIKRVCDQKQECHRLFFLYHYCYSRTNVLASLSYNTDMMTEAGCQPYCKLLLPWQEDFLWQYVPKTTTLPQSRAVGSRTELGWPSLNVEHIKKISQLYEISPVLSYLCT